MESNFLTEALHSLRSGAQWHFNGTNYESLRWLEPPEEEGGQSKPTLEEIEAEMQRLQTEYEAKEYQRLRAPKYPNLKVLADALYWSSKGDNSHLEAYYASCEEVKNEYPKS
jgi:hypothetical protein